MSNADPVFLLFMEDPRNFTPYIATPGGVNLVRQVFDNQETLLQFVRGPHCLEFLQALANDLPKGNNLLGKALSQPGIAAALLINPAVSTDDFLDLVLDVPPHNQETIFGCKAVTKHMQASGYGATIDEVYAERLRRLAGPVSKGTNPATTFTA